jgi:aminopeptidase N
VSFMWKMSAKFLIISLIFFSLEITQSYSTEQFQYYLHRVEEVNRFAIDATKPKQQTKNDVTYRLPNDTLPLEYDLTLKTWIHESNFNFTGNVVIKLLIVEDTTTIKVHYRRTTIVSATLLTANGESILSDDDFHLEIEEEFIVVTARQTLIKGTIYVLDINYNGVLREDNVGFYRSYYTDENGETV